MTIEVTATIALVVMALATYLTRIAGPVIMARVPLSPRVEKFLKALAGSVLVALVVPILAAGDLAMKIAGAVSIAAALFVNSPMVAMAAGAAAAVAVRALV